MTKAEVRRTFGDPDFTHAASDGAESWHYRDASARDMANPTDPTQDILRRMEPIRALYISFGEDGKLKSWSWVNQERYPGQFRDQHLAAGA